MKFLIRTQNLRFQNHAGRHAMGVEFILIVHDSPLGGGETLAHVDHFAQDAHRAGLYGERSDEIDL